MIWPQAHFSELRVSKTLRPGKLLPSQEEGATSVSSSALLIQASSERLIISHSQADRVNRLMSNLVLTEIAFQVTSHQTFFNKTRYLDVVYCPFSGNYSSNFLYIGLKSCSTVIEI